MAEYEKAIALLTRATKDLHRDTLGLKANVAGFMVDVGGFDKVEQLIPAVFEARRKIPGEHHSQSEEKLQNRAALYKKIVNSNR